MLRAADNTESRVSCMTTGPDFDSCIVKQAPDSDIVTDVITDVVTDQSSVATASTTTEQNAYAANNMVGS